MDTILYSQINSGHALGTGKLKGFECQYHKNDIKDPIHVRWGVKLPNVQNL